MISAYSTSSTVKTSENDFSQLHGQCPNVRIWKIVFIKDGQFPSTFCIKVWKIDFILQGQYPNVNFEKWIMTNWQYIANVQMLTWKNNFSQQSQHPNVKDLF